MKRLGFTLMEMLGVILVLAIIAVITIPIMINIVEKTRKNAAKNTALGYLSGIEEYIQMSDLGNEKYSNVIDKNKVYQVSETGYEALGEDEIKDKEVAESSNLNNLIGATIKGDKPTEGIVSLDEKGKVEYAELIIKKYIVVCTNDTNCSVNKAYSDRVKPKLTIGNVTSTKDSITIPYTLIIGTSGATVECLYGENEDNIKSKGVVDENNNKCELSNLKSDTIYYFKLTPTSGEGLVGKSDSGNIITQKGTISAILQKDGEKESDGKYYYDKDTTTNNIILGEYCWLAINTDEEGNARLIYNGEVKNGQCTGENASIGESKFSTVYNESDYETSAIKTVVDNWYNDHLSTNYSEKINSIDLITKEEAEIVGGGYLANGESYWTKTATGESTIITSTCNYDNCGGSGNCKSESSAMYVVNISGILEENNNGTYSNCISNITCENPRCGLWCNDYNQCTSSNRNSCSGQYKCGGGTCCEWPCSYGCSGKVYAVKGSLKAGSCVEISDSCNMRMEDGVILRIRPTITINNTLTIQDGNGTPTKPYILN